MYYCLPAGFFSILGVIVAEEEPALEELNGDDGEDELEEHVHSHDVHHIPQRVHHTIKHCLQLLFINFFGNILFGFTNLYFYNFCLFIHNVIFNSIIVENQY